jgi:glycosyltransferase involved in cell wall biosynthesis
VAGEGREVRVLIVSGIWPPDVGGPASHAPELAEFLRDRGHQVEVVVTADSPPAKELYPVRWTSRRWPIGVRHAQTSLLIARRAAASDVVYVTGLPTRAAIGAAIARRPLVVKITSDTTYERAIRRGWFEGDLDEFQRTGGGLRVGLVVRGREVWLRRAAHVFCPSAYLRELAIGWGLPPERVSVIANPAPAVGGLAPRSELRGSFGMDGPTLAFGGRLGFQKALRVALEALAQVDGVSLLLAGDGPERASLEEHAHGLRLEKRTRFLGPQPRERVLELFRAADASLLSSAWENFPHGVVESLAVGTPVISTDVGGIAEVLRDGENGLLVPSGDPTALAGAIRRFFADEELRRRLTEAAEPSVADYAPERLLGRIEAELEKAARQ